MTIKYCPVCRTAEMFGNDCPNCHTRLVRSPIDEKLAEEEDSGFVKEISSNVQDIPLIPEESNDQGTIE